MEKHPISARVCRYILRTKGISKRAAARILKVHHRTFERYLRGEYEPNRVVKHRMALLMRVPTYLDLVKKAY